MLEHVERLLKQAMGLDDASIGAAAVERAVAARIGICGLPDLPAYWSLVSSNAAELQALIEIVVVPETWFFRDREAFAALPGMALAGWHDGSRGCLRIASVPCSTGEEPYSIAMTLLEAGFAPARLDICGIDISGQTLACARAGVYGRNSFRGGDLSFRDRWFSPGPDGYRLSDTVRGCVRFDRANLFDPGFPLGPASCDVVFCRNLLIYFDRPTQIRAIGILTGLLTADGVLFVGPAETSLPVGHGFEPVPSPRTFAFRKRPAPASPAPAPAPTRTQPHRPARPAFSPAPAAEAAPPERQPGSIAEIRRLADLGRLDEATRRCEAQLRENGGCAELHYLIGLIDDARGDRSLAAAAYRKALYLDPDHLGALAQLAALLASTGDRGGAQVLGERLRRLSRTA